MRKYTVTRSKTYGAIHQWLHSRHGKAYYCSNPNCDGISKKYDWALKKGYNYNHCVDNFMQLCKTCHKNYDMTEDIRNRFKEEYRSGRRKMPTYKLGKPLKSVDMLTLDGKYIKSFPSVKEAAKEMKIMPNGISMAIKGSWKRKTAAGYKWRLSESEMRELGV